ncbi:MAG TPA: hypothetical protein VEC06_08610 [Paucimonas sp.]|nr:hypothetical protein [Paucimonas sp.]
MPRSRLFRQLDEFRKKHAVVWIASPPGAGKTTLAASYLTAANAPAIWCQVDRGDADPATLFFFLAEAVRDDSRPLPLLTPELDNNIPRFARMFFREFYARLPQGAVVVFDNIHDFDWDKSGYLFDIAFSEVPYGITVFALSRDAPPTRYARHQVNGHLVLLGWESLRLDDGEARELVGLEQEADAPVPAWLEQVDGWAGGIVMLRHLAERRDQSPIPLLKGQEAIFRYFAAEILEQMPSSWQRMLMLLSCLSAVSAADTEALTGDPAANSMLGQLYRNKLFIDRRGGETPTYHFHALFRDFLQHAAAQRLDAAERTQLLERAAAIFDNQGRADEAAPLYRDSAAYCRLAALLLRHAGAMLSIGRGRAWCEWMSWLPEEHVRAEPRLWYWQGMALIHIDPPLAREALTQAEQAFLAAGDLRQRLLCIAAIIDSHYYEWADFSALPQCVEWMLESLSALDVDTLPPEDDLRIHSRLAVALELTVPGSPAQAPSAKRASEALSKVDDPTERLAAGGVLLDYANWAHDSDIGVPLVRDLQALSDDPAVSPFHRGWWKFRVAFWHRMMNADYEAAQQSSAAAKKIADEFGLDMLLFEFQHAEIFSHLCTGQLDAARKLLDETRQSLRPTRRVAFVYLSFLEGIWLQQSGDIDAGLRIFEDVIRRSAEVGVPAAQRPHFEMGLANAYALADRFADADAAFARAVAAAHGKDRDFVANIRQFVVAYACLHEDREQEAIEILREAFERHRQSQIRLFFPRFRKIATALTEAALRAGIEVDHVREIIVRQGLGTLDRSIANWPRPISIHALGNFELRLGGSAVASSGKAQQRLLLLLKILVAAGDQGMAMALLATHLWPDADEPRSTLNVTVHRLRKLLGNEHAIVVDAGSLRLDTDVAWTDVSAFTELCDRIAALDTASSRSEIRRLAEGLRLYRAHFCPGDTDELLTAARENLRRRFSDAVDRLGPLLERMQEWSAARGLYERAMEADPAGQAGRLGLARCERAKE